jgi:alpha-L-fucosidase 2
MKIYFCLILSVLLSHFLNCTALEEKQDVNADLKLWYTEPAEKWTEALPVGNGRLGAMVFGKVRKERIQLNEESLWAGQPINNNNPAARKHLNEIQRLLLAGNNTEARNLAVKFLLGTPPRIRSYQTLGDLILSFELEEDPITIYKRDLDLSTGIHSVKFNAGDTEYTREIFVSAPDNVILINISAAKDSKINMGISLKRDQDAVVKTVSDNEILLTGQIIDQPDPLRGPGGKHMKFAAKVIALNDGGRIHPENNQLIIENGHRVTLILTAATDYNMENLNFDRSINPVRLCETIIAKARSNSYTMLRERHISDHSAIFNRVEIDLGSSMAINLPTDARLEKVKSGMEDPHLIALYFQYGRYLLMGSSRYPGVLPANLQGIWNEHYEAPWNSDFHTNINLQMNYWPSDVCNLPETVWPLTNFFMELLKPGQVTAKEMYDAQGWTMHHVTDPFGRTGLMDGIHWGTSPLAGAWMAITFWRHFQFSQDKSYLKTKAYPIMKGAVQFIFDFLIKDKKGRWITAPSMSPENAFVLPGSKENHQLTYMSTIDLQIITELFNACFLAAEILGEDPDFKSRIKNVLEKLPANQIGKDGTIQEWIEDYQEAEPGHRHMSHLFGVHPGTQITPDTEELFEAAQKTVRKRLAHGGGHTGWSRAWIINFYARFLDAESAYYHVLALLRKSILPNLFDNHPPFQIDGNFGGSAGIAEMLLQSHNRGLHILPALPKAWKTGFVKGLKARGNFEIDIIWEENKLLNLTVKSLSGGKCRIRYQNNTQEIDTDKGNIYSFDGKLQRI